MNDNIEVLEYLKQIKDINKKRLFWTRISVVLVAILVVVLASLVPVVFETLKTAQGTLYQANDAIIQANGAIVQAQDIMATTSEKINSVDFSGLNKAIDDLTNVVSKLTSIVNLKQ